MKWAVIDDFGDDWEFGNVAHQCPSYEECQEWAENENYHSASIVTVDEYGIRIKVTND